MSKKILIWIQGSNGSGKTTQSRLLTELFAGKAKEDATEKIGDDHYYTVYGKSGLAVMGKMGKNQCTGLDSVYSKLGAAGVSITLAKALGDKDVRVIICECVFATMAWYNRWVEAGLRDKFILFAIHLELTMWENFKRIQERRTKKAGEGEWYNTTLPDTVYKNVGAKNRETRNIYMKLEGTHETSDGQLADFALQVNAALSEKAIHEMMADHIIQHL